MHDLQSRQPIYPTYRSANGAAILVLGILAWVGLGFFTGLPAWIWGNQSLRDIEIGRADPSERGLVQAGRLLGMINCIMFFAAAGIMLLFLILAIAGGVFATTRG